MSTVPSGGRTALFVHEVSRAGQIGPLAPWVTMANWAGAARERYGQGWVITPEGVVSPNEALQLASQPARDSGELSYLRRRLPEPAVTLAKDARRLVRSRRFRSQIDARGWRGQGVPFVAQLHGLFCDAGLALADDLGVPSVLVVDACQVEEAREWGVRRPGWSSVAERIGEVPQLRVADLVACVSAEVASSVADKTGRREGVAVIPNGVDTEFFLPGRNPELRAALGLEHAFVVGWTGSFRSFHGLTDLIRSAASLHAKLPDLALLLVGDGLERPAIAALGEQLGVRVVFPGTVPYQNVPDYLRVMDAAVVLAAPVGGFHYSPVKLREYQACSVPVIASRVGEMSRDLMDRDDALLVAQGNVAELADAIRTLHGDRSLAQEMSARAREEVLESGSWLDRLVHVERLLGITGDAARPTE